MELKSQLDKNQSLFWVRKSIICTTKCLLNIPNELKVYYVLNMQYNGDIHLMNESEIAP